LRRDEVDTLAGIHHGVSSLLGMDVSDARGKRSSSSNEQDALRDGANAFVEMKA
jgi:hypothetical protein